MRPRRSRFAGAVRDPRRAGFYARGGAPCLPEGGMRGRWPTDRRLRSILRGLPPTEHSSTTMAWTHLDSESLYNVSNWG
ncbi:MAG: hypothetical protein ACK55I_15340, partial [bacterium]